MPSLLPIYHVGFPFYGHELINALAIFVTPLVVILGWCMDKDMSLYFTLFETVCLFVTAFVVNFLVLDGRSNYLEGALLIAAYVIIALGAFFYPDNSNASAWAGA